jgi:hypothetical protein
MEGVERMACGCRPEQAACEVGRGLLFEVRCVHALIWHQAFVLYPECWREVVWRTYHEAVEAYLCHCGYVVGTVADVG